MLRDAVLALMRPRLGSRDDLDAAIIAEMQYVQEFSLEQTGAFTPWFLESELSQTLVAAGEERVPLPSDFLGEVEDQHLWMYVASETAAPFTELHKSSYDRLIVKYPILGRPSEYALTGNYFLLRPVPSVDYVLKMRYYAKDAPLTSNIENQWLKYAGDLVIAETSAIIAGNYIQNPAMAERFKGDAAQARTRLYTKHEARKHVNRTYGMGED